MNDRKREWAMNVLTQLMESCVKTHEMQMRVFRSKEENIVRVELCVNYHTVCEFYLLLETFNEVLEKAAGYAPLYWDQITEVNYMSYN